MSNVNINQICEEIFIAPSNEIKPERFSQEESNVAAPCNGKCRSGTCLT